MVRLTPYQELRVLEKCKGKTLKETLELLKRAELRKNQLHWKSKVNKLYKSLIE